MFPEEFAVQVSERGEECECLGFFEGGGGGARVVNQHVVRIRVRWRLMKARLSFRCRP